MEPLIPFFKPEINGPTLLCAIIVNKKKTTLENLIAYIEGKKPIIYRIFRSSVTKNRIHILTDEKERWYDYFRQKELAEGFQDF